MDYINSHFISHRLPAVCLVLLSKILSWKNNESCSLWILEISCVHVAQVIAQVVNNTRGINLPSGKMNSLGHSTFPGSKGRLISDVQSGWQLMNGKTGVLDLGLHPSFYLLPNITLSWWERASCQRTRDFCRAGGGWVQKGPAEL